jgi:signal transduction histidine kinase/CheY-like chemotaxis protein
MSHDDAEVFPRRGELATVMRSKDWTATAVGAPSSWPSSLRTVLRLMLASRYAMWLGWGPDLTFFYNDAYASETLATKHPWALGRSAREVWSEIWDAIGPRIEHVLKTGEATWDEALLLFLERSGYPEETYHTFSYSPAPGDSADAPAGLFCVVVEETERVIGERRLALLRDFAALLAHAKTVAEVFAAAERCLSRDARDITFSLTFLFEDDGNSVRRVASTGFEDGHPAAPQHVAVNGNEPWPFSGVLAGEGVRIVPLAAGERPWPRGAWKRAPSNALVVPLTQLGESRPAGAFIAGANPHRPLDESLRSFVELFVGQLSAGLANARAYEAERRRADALAEIDRAKTAFFSNVSHEFRTPLTLMLGPTEDAIASPERALRGADLDTVHRNELRLLKLVNTLLDFARIEAGRIQASYAPADLCALTTDLASSFRSAIERAALVYEVDCEPMPEPIFIDHDMWEKIVFNLLSNALKFTFEGRIVVSLRWRGDHAELSVRDTGVGIAAEELPRIFERFHRIEGGRARTHEGSGIGLALVHELVRLHGGKIGVESTVGAGTTFTIVIPRGTAHLPHDRISAARSSGSSSVGSAYIAEALRWMPGSSEADDEPISSEPSATSRAHILVVDDNADMREYVARILRKHWTVETAGDGATALEAARARRPDLVLSDVMMPGIDGFALVRELRADPRIATTPIMLLSARAGEEAAAEGLRAGADDYLVKPFSASALVVRIEAQLSAARLREAERARLELMVRESPAAICVVRGPSLTIELANPRILQVWGKDEDVIGKPLMEAVPELVGQGFDDLMYEVMRSGRAHQGREQHVRVDRDRDGSLEDTYFDFVYAPIHAPDGTVDAIFVDAYEVTDKVLAYRYLEHLRKDAEAANRLKDEFLATMSHELRTPLNAILGWASLLRRGQNDKASLERALTTIERNARAQARLIDDVLDVSRIVSGKLRLELRRIDLNKVVLAAVDVVRPAADAKRLRMVVDLAPGDSVVLAGDPDRLQQVAWNLLSNAIKFTPSDGTVTLRTERVGSQARLVVQDTGIGIAREHLPFIFERFRQVDSSRTRKHGGLGLGLAIVRHLVELHGGVVTADTDGAGKGTTFRVDLPVRVFDEAPVVRLGAATAADRAKALPGDQASLSGLEILVVDDEEDSRFFLEVALERAGASVCLADSARAAFEVLENRHVDVLISDIGMPDEDGLSFMQRIRALPADKGGRVPAIALSAYARNDDAARALDVGYQRHLAKPAEIETLVRTVVSLVDGDRSRPDAASVCEAGWTSADVSGPAVTARQ